jgi:hypothetical protein
MQSSKQNKKSSIKLSHQIRKNIENHQLKRASTGAQNISKICLAVSDVKLGGVSLQYA